MFAVVVIEREVLQAKDIGDALVDWTQRVGGIAALCLVIWLIARGLLCLQRRRTCSQKPAGELSSLPRRLLRLIFAGAVLLSCLGYIAYAVALLPHYLTLGGLGAILAELTPMAVNFLTLGGLGAILAVLTPMTADLFRLKPRRIWALSRLTFLEVIRLRVLWVFLGLLLVFLFPPRWFFPILARDEVSIVVKSAYWIMMVLLWFTAALLASFGLPTDIRRQTIHTVLTKPIERLEIVMGRFFGYVLVMSLVLAVMTSFSLLLILTSGAETEAVHKSYHAREPLYGDLKFQGSQQHFPGLVPGRTLWGYRTYITGPGPGAPRQSAIWTFKDLPAHLAERAQVRCEFAFDIGRVLGKEGAPCSFYFISGNCPLDSQGNPVQERAYNDDATRQKSADELARKYGFHKVPSINVQDKQMHSVLVPGGLFAHALEAKSLAGQSPEVRVRVQSIQPSQYVGIARYDLYFRLDDHGDEPRPGLFAWNFCKGAMGLWFRVCLVIGVGVALSTYLSGAVSFLGIIFIYLGGIFRPFIKSLIERSPDVVGPLESLYRLTTAQGGPIEATTVVRASRGSDEVFRWLLARIFSIFPDLERYNLKDHVAEGFNISVTSTLGVDNLVPFIGYMLPWLVLAYYLLRWREVATS